MKIPKKIFFFFFLGGGVRGGGGGGGGGGGCERRIEVFVKYIVQYYENEKMWGEGEGGIFEPKTLSMYLKK